MDLTSLLNKCKSAKRVFLYGAGNYGKHMNAYLVSNGIDIAAFVVSDSGSIMVKSFRGIPVIGISDLTVGKNDLFIVCVSAQHHEEIEKTLKGKGVNDAELMDKENYEYIMNSNPYKFIQQVPNKKYIQVLYFHRVIEKDNDPWQLEIRPQIFEQYIRYISDNYPVLRFEDDWSNVREKSIVITFDDGYWDNYEYALPILEKYSVPATFFISTQNIGKNTEYWWDRLARFVNADELVDVRNRLRRLLPQERDEELDHIEEKSGIVRRALLTDRAMNEEEIKLLSESPYVTIGSHTVWHNMLSAESPEEQRYDISESKRLLEAITGKGISVFSIPFGQPDTYSNETLQILKECGYKKVATTDPMLSGAGTDPFHIPRIAQTERVLEEFVRDLEMKWYLEGDN